MVRVNVSTNAREVNDRTAVVMMQDLAGVRVEAVHSSSSRLICDINRQNKGSRAMQTVGMMVSCE
jgi:hypothetical protein